MEKWEKLDLKIEILNTVYEGERHYRILHDDEGTPVLYMLSGGTEYPRARGISNIDYYISTAFKCNPSKCNDLINFLREEILFQ